MDEKTPSEGTPLTRNQVARRLGLSPERIRQLSNAGRLQCTRTPLGRLYDEAEVERFAACRGHTTTGSSTG
ncbi:MerR family transcriptional regulator [Pseudonocardia sp. Cha107L01]|uniref:MerR family transcriptional regulator n=1 Tax=Pseudonocardia sp. Cha107L01 TaxID=3457576 RepID=UPI00403E833A